MLLQTRERLLRVEPDSRGERGCEFAMDYRTSSRRYVHFCNENERLSRSEVQRWINEHLAKRARDNELGRALKQRCGLGKNIAAGWLFAATPARQWPAELGTVLWCTWESDADSDASDSSVADASE